MKNLLTVLLIVTVVATGYYAYNTYQLPVQEFDSGIIEQITEAEKQIKAIAEQIGELSQGNLLGADSTLPIAGATYSLYSGVSSSATSLTLSSLTIPQSGYNILDSDLSSTFYLTLEPGNRSRQEIVSCTTVTQNAGGTATLSGCTRGLSPISPYTASSTLQFSHAGGSAVIFADPPQLFNQYAAKDNDETVTGIWTYTSTAQPRYDATPSLTGNSLYLATVGYVDALANQGAATSSESAAGISELATQLQMASSTDLGANDPLVLQAKYATSSCQVVGLYSLVTANNGKLSTSCLDLTTTYSWSGLHTFTTTATTSLSGGLYATRISAPYFHATSTTATTTLSGNLVVANNASTTNLFISGRTTGGPMTYTASSTAYSASSGTVTYTGSIPSSANVGISNATFTLNTTVYTETFIITRAGLTSVDLHERTNGGTDYGAYTFSWSGSNFSIEEFVDTNTNSSVAGTIYWYK